MPELPEVETLCRQLTQAIAGQQIFKSKVLDARLGAIEQLAGRRVAAVIRRGKSLAMDLEDGVSLVVHLRMTGGFRWQGTARTPLAHTRFTLSLSAGDLVLVDPRRFATVTLRSAGDGEAEAAPALDPLGDFSLTRLRAAAEKKSLPVKSFLMDQRVIAGIGNIYACEILHAAAINPERQTNSLTPAAWREIKRATVSIIRRAIVCRGTSVSDWRDLYGNPGEYQNHLRVYGRAGASCPRCRANIVRIKLGGRGTYFCASCQR